MDGTLFSAFVEPLFNLLLIRLEISGQNNKAESLVKQAAIMDLAPAGHRQCGVVKAMTQLTRFVSWDNKLRNGARFGFFDQVVEFFIGCNTQPWHRSNGRKFRTAKYAPTSFKQLFNLRLRIDNT